MLFPRMTTAAGLCVAGVLAAFALSSDEPLPRQPEWMRNAKGPYPSDWFGTQRSFPGLTINQEAIQRALVQARADRARVEQEVARVRERLRARRPGDHRAEQALAWANVGPYNIGGRVTALAIKPDETVLYLASANGGLFKSTNLGTNWTPIFQEATFFSIGALALDPSNTSTVYCGTGEANASVDSYDGNGLYRSTDAGATWSHLGLTETARIARVAVDPSNSNRIFVAAMGRQFSTGPHRGLYRSEDGGANWTKVLFLNDSTGVNEVVIHPTHPETVYCATWERVRRPTYRRAFGPSTGIWRSADYGSTWTRLQTGLPAPSDNVGRIALAMARSQPTTIYAQIIEGAALGYDGLGMYRTTDAGETWTKRDAGVSFQNAFGGFGWYFGDCVVDPVDPNKVYALGVQLARSLDGGISFTYITGTAHVDQHAMWINPLNTNRIFLGNDGGFYRTTTGSSPWTKSLDLPITQFYAGAVDPSDVQRVLGGTQDNNTLQTFGNPISWTAMLGGDGFQCMVDPLDPNIVFAEYQFCSQGSGLLRSTTGGNPNSFFTPNGFSISDRYNWNTPIVMSPHDHNIILVGSQRVYRSVDNGLNYNGISGDLTTNNAGALVVYSTLTTLDISPADGTIYYAGSDDGQVHRSTNGGVLWENVSAGLPVRYVTKVAADPVDAQVVYTTLSGFGQDESTPHVYRSTDQGSSWTPIAGNLPDVPVNDIIVDPENTSRLFIATDVGVYVTNNLGGFWSPLGVDLPLQAIFDLVLHAPTRTLFAATHGRSQWRFDLNELVDVEAEIAPVRLALSSPLPNPSRGETRLTLDLPRAASVDVSVFDAQGRRVQTLHRGELGSGRHPMAWDGRDHSGAFARAGVYLVRASDGSASAVQRVVLNR